MKLREEAHKALDELDHRSLALVYQQMRLLLDIGPKSQGAATAPSIEEIWAKADTIPGCWSDDLAEEREERF